ncbi:MAG TPA: YCF48-related protein, partial [Chitinophagaceae bacterium]|nr:YCF48-related protein [Chitinophagaceae bacterium]
MKLQTPFSIFFLAITFSASAQWSQVASPTKSNLNDIEFYKSRYGFAVGEDGVVLRSKDGGQTWELAASPEKTNLTSVTVLDSVTIFVTTSSYPDASVYRSVNAGNSWKKVLGDTRTMYAGDAPDNSVYAI